MAMDSCIRMSHGAGAPGGETKITNFVLSCTDFPLSTGHTDYCCTVASLLEALGIDLLKQDNVPSASF